MSRSPLKRNIPPLSLKSIESVVVCECDKKVEVSPSNTTISKFRTSHSRSKSAGRKGKKRPLGVMEKNIYQNLEYYKSMNHPKGKERYTEENIKFALFPNEEEMKIKPELNEKSLKLYEKVKRERKLSPNVFERLKDDEEHRSRSKIISIINRIKEVTPSKKISRQDL
jgi:hypothetical protein